MVTSDWIAVGIAAITLINGWCQFLVKERLFSNTTTPSPTIDAIFKSKSVLWLIGITGLVSIASIWLLVLQVLSPDPITRTGCLVISSLTVLSVLNMVLVQSFITLRRLAVMSYEMRVSAANLKAFAAAHG